MGDGQTKEYKTSRCKSRESSPVLRLIRGAGGTIWRARFAFPLNCRARRATLPRSGISAELGQLTRFTQFMPRLFLRVCLKIGPPLYIYVATEQQYFDAHSPHIVQSRLNGNRN